MQMAKPKRKHRDLPPRMVRRTYRNAKGELWEGYYYEHPRDEDGKRKLTPLGDDILQAKIRWAEMEGRSRKRRQSRLTIRAYRQPTVATWYGRTIARNQD